MKRVMVDHKAKIVTARRGKSDHVLELERRVKELEDKLTQQLDSQLNDKPGVDEKTSGRVPSVVNRPSRKGTKKL